MFTLLTMLSIAKEYRYIACFVKDRKSVHCLPVMNAMASKVNDDEGYIVPNGSDDVRCTMMMTDYA